MKKEIEVQFTMNISVVVVCYNEEKNIIPCLQSLINQKYPMDKYEILVVDNDSTDKTKALIKEFIKEHSSFHISLIINPIRGISVSRNIGWQEAKFGFIAYIDADCQASPHWLMTMAQGFHRYQAVDEHLAGVGGGNIPNTQGNKFLEALSVLLDTFWGNHGSTQGKRFTQDKLVPHIPTLNILYDRNVLVKVRGFDESYGNICEDTELNHRLIQEGYTLIFLKDSIVFHNMRSNLSKWFFNMITYGKGRVWVIRKHPSHFQLMYLIPLVFILSLILPLFSWINPWFSLPLLYFPLLGMITLYELWRRRGKWELLPTLYLSYLATHVGFGLGEWYGLFRGMEKK